MSNNSNPTLATTNSNTTLVTKNQNQTNAYQQTLANTQIYSNLNLIEVENHFILRMPILKQENGNIKPHPVTLALRQVLSEQPRLDDEHQDPSKNRLFIEINSETRIGRVKFDDEIFEARLVDLPCIIESLKTKDKKMFYKTADISQMLVCKTKDDSWSDIEEEINKMEKGKKNSETKNSLKVDTFIKKYQWPHGITPPLKNVRRKRFRKVAKKRILIMPKLKKR